MSKYSLSVSAFENSSQIDISNIKVWNNLGNAYFKSKNYQKANEAFKKVLEMTKTSYEIWFNLGIVCIKQKDYNYAVECLKKSAEIYPENYNVWLNLGYIFQTLNKNKEAIQFFRNAINIDVERINAWYNLAITYFKMKDYIRAVDSISRVIEKSNNKKYYLVAKLIESKYKFRIVKKRIKVHKLSTISQNIINNVTNRLDYKIIFNHYSVPEED